MNPLMYNINSTVISNGGIPSGGMNPLMNPSLNQTGMSNSPSGINSGLSPALMLRSVSNDNNNTNNNKNLKKSECSVIIRDLSFFCNENHLKELVACYGPCIKIHICRSEESNHRSLLHAFVEMANEDSIYNLIEELNAVVFMGRQLKIQRCHENPEMKDILNQKVEKMGIQVYVRFESMEDRTHGLVNEEKLRDVFADCGDIEDAIIQRHSQNLWRQKGYGFIFFLTFDGAEFAVKTKNGIMYDNVYYQCEYTHKAKEKINAMIAAPDQFLFYKVGGRSASPFSASFETTTAAVSRGEYNSYSSPLNNPAHAANANNYSGSYTYGQDPSPRPAAPPVQRGNSLPTNYSVSSSTENYSRSSDTVSSFSTPYEEQQSWNYQQGANSANNSYRKASNANQQTPSYANNVPYTNLTSSQEFNRASEHYSESLPNSFLQQNQPSSASASSSYHSYSQSLPQNNKSFPDTNGSEYAKFPHHQQMRGNPTIQNPYTSQYFNK